MSMMIEKEVEKNAEVPLTSALTGVAAVGGGF
jgi:hypothetical protein